MATDDRLLPAATFRPGGERRRQRVRPRAAVRRRRLRGHPRLQRPRLQARSPHRAAVRLGPGDSARHPDTAATSRASSSLETCRRNDIVDGYIRLVVTRGAGDLGIDPRSCPRAEIIVIARPIARSTRSSHAGRDARHVVAPAAAPDALSPSIKSLNYLNNVLARIEANDRRRRRSVAARRQRLRRRSHRRQLLHRHRPRPDDAADGDEPERHHARDGHRAGGRSRHPVRGAVLHALRRLDGARGVHVRHLAEIVPSRLWTDARLGAAVRAHQARRRHASRRRPIEPFARPARPSAEPFLR